MRGSKSFAFAAFLTLTIHLSQANAQGSWPYLTRAQAVETPPNVGGEYAAKIIGLPLLTEQTLPPGYREYRFEIHCGMCLPIYLIRLRTDPRGKVFGDAYLLWFPHDPTLTGADERERRINSPPNNCASSLRESAAHDIGYGDTWCPARLAKDLDWARLFGRLDSLGVLTLATVSGYSPPVPYFGVDTVKVNDQTFYKPHRPCNDIASRGLEISVLLGTEYRAAHFDCLESKPSGKTEYSRVSRAYELLSGAVESYRSTPH